jgi:hypothetical protein
MERVSIGASSIGKTSGIGKSREARPSYHPAGNNIESPAAAEHSSRTLASAREPHCRDRLQSHYLHVDFKGSTPEALRPHL